VASARAWREAAEAAEGSPYFTRWGEQKVDLGRVVQDAPTGTRGLKRDYIQQTPVHTYAPMDEGQTTSMLADPKVAAALVSVPAALVSYLSLS